MCLGNAVRWLATTASEGKVDIKHFPPGVSVLLSRVLSPCWGLVVEGRGKYMGMGADASRYQRGGQMALKGGAGAACKMMEVQLFANW